MMQGHGPKRVDSASRNLPGSHRFGFTVSVVALVLATNRYLVDFMSFRGLVVHVNV